MKKYLLSLMLIIIDIATIYLFGKLHLQDIFTIGIYFIPALINVLLCKYINKTNKYKDCAITLLLMVGNTGLITIALSFWFYFSGQDISSVIALCAFAFLFFFVPNLISAIIYFIRSRKGNE